MHPTVQSLRYCKKTLSFRELDKLVMKEIKKDVKSRNQEGVKVLLRNQIQLGNLRNVHQQPGGPHSEYGNQDRFCVLSVSTVIKMVSVFYQ